MTFEEEVLNYKEEYLCADTNVIIRRIEDPLKYSLIFQNKKICATNYTLMELYRGYVSKIVSLYNFISENDCTINKIFETIEQMIKEPNRSKEANSWRIILIKIIEYPENANKRYILYRLKNLIKIELNYKFKKEIFYFIPTRSKCDKIGISPNQTRDKFYLDFGCSNCDAYINYDIMELLDIITGISSQSDKYFVGLRHVLDKLINGRKLDIKDCKFLGDVIISLDTPNDIPLITADCDHMIPICNSLGKQIFCDDESN